MAKILVMYDLKDGRTRYPALYELMDSLGEREIRQKSFHIIDTHLSAEDVYTIIRSHLCEEDLLEVMEWQPMAA